MRYAAIYVDSVGQWAVVDTLSDGFALALFDTEDAARDAARAEERRWVKVVATSGAAVAAS